GLDVGRDHAFFDQLVRVVALDHAGLGDLALRAEDEADFAGLELYRATLRARLVEDPVQLVQAFDLRKLRADLRQRRIAVLVRDALAHRVPDLGIGQAQVRVHHRFIELRRGDDAI